MAIFLHPFINVMANKINGMINMFIIVSQLVNFKTTYNIIQQLVAMQSRLQIEFLSPADICPKVIPIAFNMLDATQINHRTVCFMELLPEIRLVGCLSTFFDATSYQNRGSSFIYGITFISGNRISKCIYVYVTVMFQSVDKYILWYHLFGRSPDYLKNRFPHEVIAF